MRKLEDPSNFDLQQLKAIADFQFGKGAGEALFKQGIEVERSRGTKRIRFIYKNGERICSFRVRDGYLVPSLLAGKILHQNDFSLKVVVNKDSEPFVREGKTVFSKHVIYADEKISPKEEVIIVNQEGEFIGIGTAKISGQLINEMNKGIAVSTRKGIGKKE